MSDSDSERENFEKGYAAWIKKVPKIEVYMDSWREEVYDWNKTKMCVRCKK